MSAATGRPEREYRSAQRAGRPVRATGRSEREYRGARHVRHPVRPWALLVASLLLAILGTSSLTGCERTFRDMYDQPSYKPLAESACGPTVAARVPRGGRSCAACRHFRGNLEHERATGGP